MKKREMFVFWSLDPPHASLRKRRNESLSRIPPNRGVGSTLPFPPIHPPIKKLDIYTQVGIEFLELPLACCLCCKFIPNTR